MAVSSAVQMLERVSDRLCRALGSCRSSAGLKSTLDDVHDLVRFT